MATSYADPLKLPYAPGLDGLRAIAILLVLVEHFLWGGGHILNGRLPVGYLGVTVFFVISGYLITSILIGYSSAFSVKTAARIFYWRRCLRLFPAYYFCIALMAALNLGGMRSTWLVNALYLTNFKVAIEQAWNGSSHFWSLAVEEQFYLLWFFVVVALPRRYLVPVIVAFLAGGPAWRAATNSSFTNTLLPGAVDSLATGAILAVAAGSEAWNALIRHRRIFLLISGCLIPVVVVTHASALLTTAINLFAASLILIAADTKTPDPLFSWLEARPLTHIGKISYGLYVYHNFLSPVLPVDRFSAIHNDLAMRFTRFLVLTLVSIGVAEISWRLIEKPALRLKDRALVATRSHPIAA